MILKIGQWLYKRFPKLHKELYFSYKNILDNNLIQLLKVYTKPGFVILDIGANIGFYSCLLSKLQHSNVQIYAFEPDTENCKRFRLNTNSLTNITLISKALSSDHSERQLYISDQLNVDHRMYPSPNHTKTVVVPSTAVDIWMKEASVFKIDLIKMDVQGYEVEVLLGMSNLLKSKHKPIIISEFWPYGLKTSGYSCEKFFKILQDAGYEISIIQGKKHILLHYQNLNAYTHLPENKYFNIIALPQNCEY